MCKKWDTPFNSYRNHGGLSFILPAAHNPEHPLEVTNDVFESRRTVVSEQAVNKLYAAKALITLFLNRL